MNEKYRKMFSLGFNGKDDFLDKVVLPFKDYVSSIYTAPPTSMGIASARTTPGVTPEKLLDLRRRLRREGIEFNLVYNFNGISSPRVIPKLLKAADYFEPDLVTVPGVHILDEFMDKTPYPLNISIIQDINSLNPLVQIMERDRGGRIVSYNIGRRRTFDLPFIRSVRALFPKLRLKLMVNEGCLFECPDQGFHSCSHTLGMKQHNDLPLFYCSKLGPDQRWRFFTGQYIPPKFLHLYLGAVDEFKLGTRGIGGVGQESDGVAEVVRDYVEERDLPMLEAMRTSYGGAQFLHFKPRGAQPARARPLDEPLQRPYPDDFFKVRSACRHDCHVCSYCRGLLKPAAA